LLSECEVVLWVKISWLCTYEFMRGVLGVDLTEWPPPGSGGGLVRKLFASPPPPIGLDYFFECWADIQSTTRVYPGMSSAGRIRSPALHSRPRLPPGSPRVDFRSSGTGPDPNRLLAELLDKDSQTLGNRFRDYSRARTCSLVPRRVGPSSTLGFASSPRLPHRPRKKNSRLGGTFRVCRRGRFENLWSSNRRFGNFKVRISRISRNFRFFRNLTKSTKIHGVGQGNFEVSGVKVWRNFRNFRFF